MGAAAVQVGLRRLAELRWTTTAAAARNSGVAVEHGSMRHAENVHSFALQVLQRRRGVVQRLTAVWRFCRHGSR